MDVVANSEASGEGMQRENTAWRSRADWRPEEGVGVLDVALDGTVALIDRRARHTGVASALRSDRCAEFVECCRDA